MSDFMFNPIQCTSEQFEGIKNQNPINAGCLYFLTDTKQMFLARPNDFVEMCGGTGIIYGDREINYPTNGSQVSPQQDFNLSDLETEELPLINDLILNSDGCFYRVNSIDGNVIETTRLTLRGSGGGGGTGSPDSPTSGNLLLKTSSTIKYFSVEQDAPAIIDLEVSCPDATNTLYAFKLSWVRNDFSNPFDTILLNDFPVNREYPLELNKYLSLIASRGNPTDIYIQAMDNSGRTVSEGFKINFCNLRLSTNEIPLLNTTISQPLNYKCSVGGTANSSIKRTVYYKLYEENKLKANPNTEPDFEYEMELGSTEIGEISQNLDLSQSQVSHGVYIMQVSVQGVIGTTSIPGQTLTHRVLVYDNLVRTPLFAVAVPSAVQRYIKTYIPILLSYDQNKNYQMRVFIDGEETNALYITANVLKDDFSVEFSTVGIKKLQFKIEELGIDVSFSLAVEKYTDDLPVIRLDHGDLKLNLAASGQTNGAVHPEIWASKVSKSNIAATLDGFYFGSVNGWMTDSNNLDYLKVSQGAEVTLSSSNYTPFTKEGVGVKGINQSGLTVELDFMIDGVTDYNANLIECLSYQEAAETSIATGFTITGDTFKYYASGSELVSLNLVQNERIRLSFVMEPKSENGTPMCYTYLNGIISNIKKRGSSNFENSATEAELKINSAGGTIYIYNIRIYEAAVDSSVILNNYQATLDTLENREKNYRQNTIRIDGKISLEEIEKETYELKIPYVKIVGGYKANKDFSMQPKNSAGVPGLPTAKNDYKAIDIEIVYPLIKQNPYFKEYINYLNPNAKTDEEKTNRSFKITTQYEDSSLNVLNAFGKKPTTGAIMYAQGTSSLEYPVKNIRVKLKGDNAKFVVRPDIAPVELITFKADYMESSGSHNTGAANYIDDLYDSIHIATPAQEYFEDKKDEYGEIVSCIKGHPCIIFWCPGVDKNGNLMDINDPNNYEYIGKYNFNLDKATPEPFGFLHIDDESFGYLTDEEGTLVLDDQDNKQNSIYCFEFLDNVVNVCNFQSDTESTYIDYDAYNPKDPDLYEINNLSETERYRSTWYNNRINEDGEVVPGWTRGFESRYPEDKIGATDADALWPLASWINSLYDKRFVQNPAQIEEANSEFFANYWKYLDEDFLLAYYVITETLLMADSRVKNMMIATWGKEWRFRTVQTDANGHEIVTISKERPSSGVYEESYDYIWYPIFYDMDTMLGLDNIGDPVKKYYDEDTVESTFNGAEILWKFVRDTLQSKIRDTYRDIEDSDYFLSETIIPYFTNNQSNLANEVLYNEDALYKYVTPVREGYAFNGSIGRQDRLYAAQGSRELSRKYFINNRLQFLSGKYNTNSYQNRDRIIFRCSQELDNLVVDPSTTFEFTSLKTGYAGVHVGAEAPYANVKFIGQQTQTIVVPEDAMKNASGSECYLYGVSNLSSIGDLSDKYITCFTPSTTIDRPFLLTELKLGNHTEGYNNPNWFSESATLDLKSFKFLQDFNFENCSGYKYEIDFKDNTQLRRILLNGSSTSGITLPVQGYIEELRLPTTMSNVCIDSHPNLTTDKFTYGFFNYQTDEYVNDFSNLEHLKLKNTGIDTYSIIKAVLAKDEELGSNGKFKTYCLHDFTWEIDSEDDLVIENDIVVGIRVLDKLASDKYASYDSSQPKSEALIGTIKFKNITKTISEYLLYEKYNTVFPNVVIDLDGAQVQSAITVKFKAADGNFDHKEILTNGTKTLAEIAATVTPPEKGQTNQTIYTFAHIWIGNNIYYLDDVKASYEMVDVDVDPYVYEQPSDGKMFKIYNVNNMYKKMYIDKNTLVNVELFKDVIPTTSLTLIPYYIASDRPYTITYIRGDKTEKVCKYLYEQKFSSNKAAPLYDYLPSDGLEEHYRYGFKGWITADDYELLSEYNITPTRFIDLESKVTQNMVLYAYHEKEDARITPTDLSFFEVKQEKVSIGQETTSTMELDDGRLQWIISIKEPYRSVVGGKITLPNQMPNPANPKEMIDITVVGALSCEGSKITDIYFMENNHYKCIGVYNNSIDTYQDASFYQCGKLKSIYIPEGHDNILYINVRAFYYCSSLTEFPFKMVKHISYRAFAYCGEMTMPNNQLALPDTIDFLGQEAFYNNKTLSLERLPKNLKAIYDKTFCGCKQLLIYHFGDQGNGSALSSSINYIGREAFGSQGKDAGTELYFYLNKSNATIVDGAFSDFIAPNQPFAIKIYDYGNYFNNDRSAAAKLFTLRTDASGLEEGITFQEVNTQ